MNFIQAVQYCIDRNLIFASYRLPHSDAVRLIIQRNPEPQRIKICCELFDQKGFLVSPFVDNIDNHSYLILPDLNYLSTDYSGFEELLALKSAPGFEPVFDNGVISKKEFLSQIEKTKKAIQNNTFQKAVIARIKVINRACKSRLTKIFQLLISSYPNTFVYLFHVNGEMWMGASPEPLLCSRKKELESVSLAGTRKLNDENLNLHNWSKKELFEQELVTRFIENSLEKLNIPYLYKTGPYTKKAGNLVHLRTDFIFNFQEVNGHLDRLVKKLHPTSAVCGLPKKAAKEFILQTEKHNRSYYSGFLGPLNLDERLLLFVNLRCMQVYRDRLVLHIGAGITFDSVAEEEWDETEIKADTLLSVINRF